VTSHRVRQFEAASIVVALERERAMRAGTWPPVLDAFLADLARSVSQSVQSGALILDVRPARSQDAGMTTLSIAEAGRLIGVHRTTIARAVARGDLDAVRVGKRARVRLADIERLGGGQQ
jgi:excisionase family DNA binding protein